MIDTSESAVPSPGLKRVSARNFPEIESVHLAKDEAHIWRAELELLTPPECWREILSQDERERACRFRFSWDQQRFIICRSLLRVLLGNYLGRGPAELVFGYSTHRKPSVAVPPSDIRFNLSHSGNRAVFAFVRERELGIDVEQIRRDFETQSVAERFFSSAERKALARIPLERRHEAFFHCWTRKEAFVKAKGDGLFLPLDQFDVSLDPGQPAQLLETRPDSEERNRWSLSALELDAQYAGALVVEGHPVTIVNRQIPVFEERCNEA